MRSTVNIEYSIHQAQHIQSTAYPVYYILPRWTVSCCRAVSHPSADHVVLNARNSHNYMLPNESSLSSHCTSLLTISLPIDRLHAPLQSRTIMASNCISNFSQSQPACLSLNLHHHGVPVRMTMAIKNSHLARLWPSSASLFSLNHNLQVYLQSRIIMASKLAQSQYPSVSPNPHNYGTQTCSITAWSASLCSLDDSVVELEGRHSIINIPPHLTGQSMGFLDK